MREHIEEPKYVTSDDDTVFALLKRRAQRIPDEPIAQWQDDNTRQWHTATAVEMLDRVRGVAKGLLGLGVTKGSTVVVYSPTCYEWGLVDFACAAIGAVLVPVYETDSASQTASIVDEVKPQVAFAGSFTHAQTLEQIRTSHPDMKYVFNFKASGIDAVIDFGQNISDEDLDAAIANVKADDLLTVVYTSGSTGKPKGAMLSNRNYTHIVLNGYEILNTMLYQPNRLLLFLPLAHCFARYIQYVAIGGNGVVGYIPSAKHLLADIRSFKPTYLLGVPRVFEKVYNAASQKAGTGLRGRTFAKAAAHFIKWSKDEQNTGRHSPLERMRHSFYMSTVGQSIRSALGPNLAWLACGGAPLNVDLAHFFNGMDGITFIQGYGMTETAAPMLVNWENDNIIGSVGKPGPGMGVRLSDDDEIQLTGPNVFLGYFQQPKLTKETMTKDGWIMTGDLGALDERGFVTITGRKKDIIITAGGKNVSPAPLEDVINTCPIVSHAVVVGDGKPFISALIELDPDMLHTWLQEQGLDASMTLAQSAENDAVRAFIQQYIDQANTNVSRAESIRKFAVLADEFNQDAGTLTPSMKVIRPKVLERYAETIENELYAPKASNIPIPATVKILENTSETVKQAQEQMKVASQRMKANVSDQLASVQEKIKKNKTSETAEEETTEALKETEE